VRRKIRTELRFLLLLNFRDKKDKIDELMENIFRTLEEIK